MIATDDRSAAGLLPDGYDEFKLPVFKGVKPLGFDLVLRRFPAPSHAVRDRATPEPAVVLLIHGASANSLTFWIPKDAGLAQHLRSRGWEVWTLDWRGSCDVVESLPDAFVGGSFADECNLFCLDEVADWDFPQALDFIGEHRRKRNLPEGPVSLVAHCFGSGALAMSIARGNLEGKGVHDVVFSTLGLFYEVPWSGWVKVEDFLIERIMGKVARANQMPIRDRRAIDSRKTPPRGDPPGNRPWPNDMVEAYEDWPSSWLPSGTERIFKGLSFMFGRPYQRQRVPSDLPLPRLFGGMHLGLYLHAGQLVRRGFADRLNAPDVFDRSRLLRGPPTAGGTKIVGDLDPTYFLDKKITLITGDQNQLWHRDSIDLMYDWLCNQPYKYRPKKRVRVGFAHQDLLWAPERAYEKAQDKTSRKNSQGVSLVYEWICKGISR